jgi:serine/threonine-protein kinase
MTLTPGARLGPYEILSTLGVGGMGEVYRARDTRLKRQVALKVLPAALTSDPDRLARFQREAEVLAAFNHPNIAQIHGLEESDGVRALVMELVEGPTLAEIIARRGTAEAEAAPERGGGAPRGLDAEAESLRSRPRHSEDAPARGGGAPRGLNLDEALPIAKQIAEALEAAHEQGIVHRDLKPANVKVREDGTVKVLDFGLAKAVEGPAGAIDQSQSPTLSAAATRAGVILGTAAYMSPEQARGRPVDKRTDIWAFGCVLYEMLAGRRAFTGETVSETLAEVLKSEPQWAALPAETPATVCNVIRRCLEKDPRRRIRDIGDAQLALEGVFETAAHGVISPAPATSLRLWQRPVPALILALSLAALVATVAAGLARWGNAPPTSRALTRFSIVPPATAALTPDVVPGTVALSPDGRALVYIGGTGPQRRLYLRRLDQVDVVPIPGTERAVGAFFSPDGQWLGFDAAGELRKVRLAGGPPLTICKLPSGGAFGGSSWGENDVIVFGAAKSGLWQVAAAGGEAKPVTTLEPGEESHGEPHILPGGNTVIFAIASPSRTASQIGVAALDGSGQRRTLLAGRSPLYASTGHIVFRQAAALWAVPFHLGRLEVRGEPVQVLDRVLFGTSTRLSLSAEGTILYVPSSPPNENTLVVVDRSGQATPLVEAKGFYFYPRFAPDGKRVAVNIGGGSLGAGEIRICDVERRSCSRLTSGNYPVWTPDGSRVTFNSTGQSGDVDLYWTRSDGGGETEALLIRPGIQWPFSWSPDGRFLTFNETPQDGSTDGLDLWLLSREGKATPLVSTLFDERMATLSPDGRWVAYQSNESGYFEIYVRSYPGLGGRELVSTNGGREAVWARDGRELFIAKGVGTWS